MFEIVTPTVVFKYTIDNKASGLFKLLGIINGGGENDVEDRHESLTIFRN